MSSIGDLITLLCDLHSDLGICTVEMQQRMTSMQANGYSQVERVDHLIVNAMSLHETGDFAPEPESGTPVGAPAWPPGGGPGGGIIMDSDAMTGEGSHCEDDGAGGEGCVVVGRRIRYEPGGGGGGGGYNPPPPPPTFPEPEIVTYCPNADPEDMSIETIMASADFTEDGPNTFAAALALGVPDVVYSAFMASAARNLTQQLYGADRDGTPGNAFKHAFWSYALTVRLGAGDAKYLTDAHERLGSGSPGPRAMDLFNNRLERDLVSRFPHSTERGMLDAIAEIQRMIESGELITDTPTEFCQS